jgi:uncharacterized protein YndB with AHSA1/START domain
VDTIRHEVWVKADRTQVFDAITRADGLDAWWGKVLHAEPEIGSVIEFDHGLGEPFRMRVVELVPGERLAWECLSDYEDAGNPASEWLGHRLVFNLRAAGDDHGSAWLAARLFGSDVGEGITILDFRHEGWSEDARWYAFCNSAWGVTLDGLKKYCETRAISHFSTTVED